MDPGNYQNGSQWTWLGARMIQVYWRQPVETIH
jgi:hypothetical protein